MVQRALLFLLVVSSIDAFADRAIAVTMDDTMRYDPAEVSVKAGEKVRFVATNKGKLVHEMVIGTRKELEDHAKHMREHPDMQHHDHDGMLRLEPGKSGEMAYTFKRAGTFYYGCLEPGHFEAGMIGKVVVR
jgi:uncharacterized cupredoxin-like copper-binding protein